MKQWNNETMKKPIISIICALSENRAIGKDNKLLWHIPEDLKRFQKITSGHPIIMGRKTFESIGNPLPNRTNIIVTRDSLYHAPDCIICPSLEEALQYARAHEQNEIFIIGGGEIYQQALPSVDKLYLTVIKGNSEVDTFFPDYSEFKKVVKKGAGRYKNHEYTFLELER